MKKKLVVLCGLLANGMFGCGSSLKNNAEYTENVSENPEVISTAEYAENGKAAQITTLLIGGLVCIKRKEI